MTREEAQRKWNQLHKMTVERGCTQAEADTARRLAAALAARFGFGQRDSESQESPRSSRPNWDARYERAERKAARRWRWEYRRCGKKNCHCVNDKGHGPYKYAKVRQGKTVRSIYVGK